MAGTRKTLFGWWDYTWATIDRELAGFRRWGRWLAAVAAVTVWIIGWGLGTLSSIASLVDPASPGSNPWTSGYDATIQNIGLAGVALTIVLLAMITFGIRPRPVGLSIPLRSSSAYWLPASLIMSLGAGWLKNKVTDWADEINPAAGTSYDPGQMSPDMVSALSWDTLVVGPAEEIGLLAGPVCLILYAMRRHRRAGWVLAVGFAVVVRVGIHLYYGPGHIFGYALWAGLLVFVWWISPSVWGLVAAHFGYNGMVILGMTGAGAYAWVHPLYTGLSLVGVALILVHLGRVVASRGRAGRSVESRLRWQMLTDPGRAFGPRSALNRVPRHGTSPFRTRRRGHAVS